MSSVNITDGILKKASFDWALKGSWEDFEKELGRVLHKAAKPVAPLATSPVPPPAVTPPQGNPSLSAVVGEKLAPVTGAIAGMPRWGQGALLGAGIGALGGALSDKKKRLRGLLQGAVVGGGLGALGGYGYGKAEEFATPAKSIDFDKVIPGGSGQSTAKGPIQKAIESGKDYVTDAASQLGTSPFTYGVGGLIGGQMLARSGNKAVSVLGAPNQPKPGKGVVLAVPEAKTIVQALKNRANQAELDTLVHQQALQDARNNPPAGASRRNPGWVSPPTADQSAANYQNLSTGTNNFRGGEVQFHSGNRKFNVKPEALAKIKQLELANQAGHSSLPTVSQANRGLKARRWGGNLIALAGGLVTAKGGLDLLQPGKTDLSKMPAIQPVFDKGGPGDKSIDNLITMFKQTDNPRQALIDYAQRGNWPEKAVKAVYDRMMGVNP